MKRKLARRAIAFLIALVLGVSFVPVNVYATEEYSIEFTAVTPLTWEPNGRQLINEYTIYKNGEEMTPSRNFGVVCEVISEDGGRYEFIDERRTDWQLLQYPKALDAGTYTVTAKLYEDSPTRVVAFSTKTITVNSRSVIVKIATKSEVVYTGEILDAEDLVDSVELGASIGRSPDYAISVTPFNNASNPNCEVGGCNFRYSFYFTGNDARNLALQDIYLNYNFEFPDKAGIFSVEILPATPTLEVVTKEFSYKQGETISFAADIIQAVRIVGVKGEILKELSPEDYEAELSSPLGEGGRYSVKVTLKDEWTSTNTNYNNLAAGTSVTKEISPITLMPVFVGGKSSEYDGTCREVNSSLIDSVYVMVDGQKKEIDPSAYMISVGGGGELCDAGEYTLIVTVPEEIPYEENDGLYVVPAGTTGTVTYTINKLEGKIDSFQIENWSCGNPAGAITLTSSTTDVSSASYQYESTDGNGYSSSEMPTNVGSYRATVTIPASKNYKEVTASCEFKIEKGILTADDFTFTPPADLAYGGEKEVTIAAKDEESGVGDITVNYYDSEGKLLSDCPSALGTYSVKIKVTEGENYEAIQDLHDASWSFTIKPRDVNDLSIVLASSGDYTYTGEQIRPEVMVNHGGSKLIEGTDYTLEYGENVHAGIDAGSVTITMQGNYTSETTKTFTIIPKDLNITITGSDKQYDGTSNVEYTALLSGLVQKDQETVILDSSQEVKAVYKDGTGQETYQTGEGYRIVFDSDFNIVCTEDEHYSHEDGLCPCRNYNLIQPTGIIANIYNTYDASEYTVTSSGWTNEVVTITADEGYKISLENTADALWTDSLSYSEEVTDKNGQDITFYLRHVGTEEEKGTNKISIPETVTYYIDTTDPTGTIAISGLGSWDKLQDTTNFDLYFNTIQSVEITAEDALSEVRSIEYFESDRAYTEEELKQVTGWKPYDGSFYVSMEDSKEFVCFAKITDNAGNAIYLSTEGAIYDKTAPAVEGVVSGGKYTTTQTVTVTDVNLDTLKLDGVDAVSPIVLEGNKDASYTIVATDKAGNSTTVSVVMQPVAVLDDTFEGLEQSSVTSKEKETIQSVLEQVEKLLKDKDTTEEEKAELDSIQKNAEALKEAIDKAEANVSTEEIKKVENLDNSNVKLEDKSDIQAAIDALEQALKNNAGNYTEAEKAKIRNSISRLESAAASVEKAEAVISGIHALSEFADTDMAEEEEEAILAVSEAYNALSGHERSMISETDRTKLETLMEDLTAYEFIEGDGNSWIKGSGKTLTFVANGAYRKYTSVGVNGKQIIDGGYTVEEGSTVVKLKPSYLETLSEGEYTITVRYTDGDAEGIFTVKAAAEEKSAGTETQEGALATGDETNLVFWSVLMGMCVLGMAVLLFERRRRSAR